MNAHKRQRLIDAVRKLDILLAERTKLDAAIAAAEDDIDDISDAAEDVVVEEDADADEDEDADNLIAPTSKAGRVLRLIAAGTFTSGAAAQAIYTVDNQVNRKRIRSLIHHLASKDLIVRNADDTDWVIAYQLVSYALAHTKAS